MKNLKEHLDKYLISEFKSSEILSIKKVYIPETKTINKDIDKLKKYYFGIFSSPTQVLYKNNIFVCHTIPLLFAQVKDLATSHFIGYEIIFKSNQIENIPLSKFTFTKNENIYRKEVKLISENFTKKLELDNFGSIHLKYSELPERFHFLDVLDQQEYLRTSNLEPWLQKYELIENHNYMFNYDSEVLYSVAPYITNAHIEIFTFAYIKNQELQSTQKFENLSEGRDNELPLVFGPGEYLEIYNENMSEQFLINGSLDMYDLSQLEPHPLGNRLSISKAIAT